MVRAGAEVFEHASFWFDGGDGVLVLENGPSALASAPGLFEARLAARGGARGELAERGVEAASDLLALFLLGPDGIRRWVAGAPVLSDDHPYLAENGSSYDIEMAIRSVEPFLEDPAVLLAGTSSAAQIRAVRGTLLRLAAASSSDRQKQVLDEGSAAAPGSALLRAWRRRLSVP